MTRCSNAMLAILLLQPAGSWISISQAQYGSTLDDIIDLTYGNSVISAERSLGWIWSAPRSSTDSRGLGQSITWAWDPSLCDLLLPAFSSDAFGIQFVDCSTIRTTMHRAFSTWSENHPAISFTETTDLCQQTGQLHANCEHAEVWVTFRNASSDPSGGYATAMQAAVAIPEHSITTDFVFTNGNRPQYHARDAQGDIVTSINRQMIEIVGGRIEFAFERPICWYVDSSFCNVFHRLKRLSDPTIVHATGAVILFTLCGFATFSMVAQLFCSFRRQFKLKQKIFVDQDGDGDVEAHEIALQVVENASLRVQAFFAALASESIIGTALRLTVLFIPWPFYNAVFTVCWDCYDFEAAAAHEIGHLLGIAHPDVRAGQELATGYTATNNTFYNNYLWSGGVWNSSVCQHAWDHVLPGVPPGIPADELRGSHGPQVRQSIMESFTTHNPSVCLFQDDYEALITMYPVCAGAPPVPRCEKSDRNIGLLRVWVFVVGPLVVGLLLSIFLHTCVERQQKSWQKKAKGQKKKKTLVVVEKEDLGVGVYNTCTAVAPQKSATRAPVPPLSAGRSDAAYGAGAIPLSITAKPTVEL